ncbi:serine hydrolase [Pelomonas sp. KK5]|uniref:serine hydrolase domain-containing protein n=1 Tax=Pelomonas sp. KK5 TaxID=1855730 RepID=UPI00097C5B4D|nr:serine hydrolase domain-containing protein [Pelomonas sp. KK5]
MNKKRTSLLLALAFAVGALFQPVQAAPAAAHDLTPVDAEAWLDGLMPSALHTARVPGAVVVLVKDGKPLLQKGYGYADFDKRVPVDAEHTLFRPGSVSKLFTWTAVMQLVEQGKLDLDADVNKYLDFQIPAWKGKTAVTLRHAMTHTTGFEETARDLLVYDQPGPDIGKVLKQYIPPYLYEPGTHPGYSNYATSLAGYIVQRVSGLPFDDYIEQKVLLPIGMTQSTFRQPLPEKFKPQMSKGYMSQDDKPKGFEVISMPPAGSLSAPGSDMGRFMMAILGKGRLGDAQILKPETVELMHTKLTKPMPDLLGIGLGFYQQDVNGHRVVGHGGDTVLFHTDLLLFPDDNIGLYVSVNSPGKDGLGKWLRDRVFESFADRYLPDQRPESKREVDEATAKQHAATLAGAYRSTRREDSTFLSLLALVSPLRVQALEDGRVAMDLAGSRSVFHETKPWFWEEDNGKRRLQAVLDENGKVKQFGLEPYVFAFIFEPVPALAGTTALVLFCGALATVLLTVLLWPVAAILRRRHGVAEKPAKAVGWVRIASVASLAACVLWGFVVAGLEELKDTSTMLPITQLVTTLAFLGGLVAAAMVLRQKTVSRALGGVWLASFLVLVVLGIAHHLISFNQWY